MDKGIKERLEQFIQIQQISIAEFERNCGLSNGYVKNLKASIGSEKLVCVLRAYPNINLRWLLTGCGDPTNEKVNQQVSGDGNTQVAGNGNQVGIASEAISVLKSQLDVKDVQIDRLLSLLEKK